MTSARQVEKRAMRTGDPSSYIARVERRDIFTVKPSARRSVRQKGMRSQKPSTRGRPITAPRSGAFPAS